MPKVSVLIPVYNGERTIARALDSVMAQTYRDFEVVVLDDGSTDSTAEIVSRYPQVRLIQQANRGIGYARQRLVEEAKGEWVAFLDHDDLWKPEKLAKQVAFTDRPGVGLIHTQYVFFYEDGRVEPRLWWPPRNACALDHVLPDNWVNTCSTLILKSAIHAVGGFDTQSSRAEDWLMWLRLAAIVDFHQVNEDLTWTMKRRGSASEPDSAWYMAEREVLEEHILPGFDTFYARFDYGMRQRYKRIISHKLGVLSSLLGEALDREGRSEEARQYHLEAIKRAPQLKGAWLRLGRHLVLPAVRAAGGLRSSSR